MSIVHFDAAKWGKGHALFTTDGEQGVPVLISAECSKTGRMVVCSPMVRVSDERMFFTSPKNLVRLLPDEFYGLIGIRPGQEFPAPVDLDDYEMRKLSTVRNPAPVFDFTKEESPY